MTSNQSLRVIQWNANGLKEDRLEELRGHLSVYNPSVVCLCETHWKPHLSPSFKSYNILRRDRITRGGGGVALLIHKSLRFSQTDFPSTENLETIGATISTQSGLVDVVSTYCPHGDCSEEELNDLIGSLKDDFILAGDFNAHHPLWERHSRPNRCGRAIADALSDEPNLSLITPKDLGTREHPSTGHKSTIDLLLSSSALSLDAAIRIGPHIGSDHLPVHSEFFTVPLLACRGAARWNFHSDASWKNWNEELAAVLASSHFEAIEDPSIAYNTFASSIVSVSRKHFRLSRPSISPEKEPCRPWFNEDCKKAVAVFRKARAAWIAQPSMENLLAKKKADAIKKRVIKKERRKSWNEFTSNLDTRGASPKVWAFTKAMLGRNRDPPVDSIVIRNPAGDSVHDPAAKADIFLNQYDLSSHLVDSHSVIHPDVHAAALSEEPCPLNNPILKAEVIKALSGLKLNSSMGADLIHNRMLANLDHRNIESLHLLFKMLFRTGFVPQSWKEAIVVPVLKPGKQDHKDEAASYRPISLTSCLSKVFERIVNNRLSWFLESKRLLPNAQSGFRSGRSTTDNLVHLEQRIKSGFNSKRNTYAVFLDISKAYDVVWIPGLLAKLSKMGVSGSTLRWLKDFLTGRSFKVRVGDQLSQAKRIVTGVPQGAILSPLLFNVMLSDFPMPSRRSGVSLLLYADDVQLDVAAKSAAEAERKLQALLNRIGRWARAWRFVFSAEKSTAVVFSRSHAAPESPLLFINGRRIPSAESAKFLGLLFDRKLLWKNQVDQVIQRCKKTANLMSILTRHKFGPRNQVLINIFKAVVRSQVDYGLIVYAGACKSRIKAIDVVLRSIMRAILGAFKSTPVELLYAELGLESSPVRAIYLAARYIFSLSQKPTSIAYDSVKLLWDDEDGIWSPRSTPCLLPLIKSLKEEQFFLFSMDYNSISQLQDRIPPWSPPLINSLSCPWSKSQALQNPAAVKQWAADVAASIPEEGLVIYTDGSVLPVENRTSAAVFIPSLNVREPWILTKGTSIFSAEMFAICRGLEIVYHSDDHFEEVFVFSDSKLAVSSFHQPITSEPSGMAAAQIVRCLKDSGTKVKLVWIPSHVGIEGNETADDLAKQAFDPSSGAQELNNPLSFKEHLSGFRKIWAFSWLQELKKCQRSSVQCRESPGIIPWQFHKRRQFSTCLHRLRSGHNRLRKFSHRLDEEKDPNCRFQCAEEEDGAHLILHCPEFSTERAALRDFCIQNGIPFDIRSLLGCNKDLDRNTQFRLRDQLSRFIASSRIYSLV